MASFMITPGTTAGGMAMMAPNKGLGTFVPEMGGFSTTTTAKDAGKRIFNFTQQQNSI